MDAVTNVQTQISYQNVLPSGSFERLIAKEAQKLLQSCDAIASCRVLVEQPYKRQAGSRFHVRIELAVPGEILVVSHAADARPVPPLSDEGPNRSQVSTGHELPYKDAGFAIRDAFHKIDRQLRDYAARKSSGVRLQRRT